MPRWMLKILNFKCIYYHYNNVSFQVIVSDYPMDGSIVSDPKSIEKTSKLNSKGEVVLTFSAEELKEHIYYSVNFLKQIFDRKKLGE